MLFGQVAQPLPDSLRAGDIVICRERAAPSGPCSVGAFGEASTTRTATYGEALRCARKLAVGRKVDVWTTYRVRWADKQPQAFQRLATYRLQA
ncbi:MAG: hypothetical protein ACHQO8_01220 [Vicinamibacterales bacterium]